MKLFNLRSGVLRGGVHPDSHKDTTADRPISTNLPLPDVLNIPLNQHAGADAHPIVKLGDKVLKGQLIAVAGGEISARLHAPSSGTIRAIGAIQAPHPSGLLAPGITIELDGEDTWGELEIPKNPFDFEPEELDHKVSDAGIVGLGGALFPAIVKLRLARKKAINTLIINGSECEPYLTADDRLMRERAAEIIDGARLMRHIARATNIVIGIEENKPQAIAALRYAAELVGAIEVVTLPTVYPMGSAEQLIKAVTGNEVPANARSADLGVLVHNVGTAFAVHEALRFGKPLISRIVTVGGECVHRPQNLEALIGTPAMHLIKLCGGLKSEPSRIVMGGPMMGQVMPNFDIPVIKGASGIIALDKHEVRSQVPDPCIRCARCVEACPMGLVPLEMASHSKKDDFDGALNYGLDDCILCGSCAYVCPSHIPLVQYFRYARAELDQRWQSENKNALTKSLMESRQARVEKETAAKEAAKAAKKKPKATEEV